MARTLGIISGSGELPVTVAKAALEASRPIFVIRIDGFVEPRLADYAGATVSMGEIGRTLALLRENLCHEVVFAGHIRRPDLETLVFDKDSERALPMLLAAAQSGDDALLSALVQVYEQAGFAVIGAEAVCKSLLMPQGLLTNTGPTDRDLRDIRKGFMVAGHLGEIDIGQGCVVCDGLVLAVEAQEGTDAMLHRVPDLPKNVRGSAEQRRGVLVKRARPMQDHRIDLPTIGLQTVECAVQAGLAGIGLHAGAGLMLQQKDAIALADENELFIMGIEEDKLGVE
ncbi:MAG: UDP-2,3-diacylglucosamine diphosphatase LpxI [Pseudomonadota bacterium]